MTVQEKENFQTDTGEIIYTLGGLGTILGLGSWAGGVALGSLSLTEANFPKSPLYDGYKVLPGVNNVHDAYHAFQTFSDWDWKIGLAAVAVTAYGIYLHQRAKRNY